jgi:hypothetical protein
MRYRIRVKGHLDPSWRPWFAGLKIEHETAGTTVLLGELPDQAALYSVLLKIHRLGLVLLGLESDEPSHDAPDVSQEAHLARKEQSDENKNNER